MSTHIYAFGSVCRGEIDLGSDIDLLACSDGPTTHIDSDKYSIYTYERLRSLWSEGNPFAWHLYLEAKLLFSSDNSDFLGDLGAPSEYTAAAQDLGKFRKLFEKSNNELVSTGNSSVFNLSCVFLAIRNFATCHSLSTGKPVFSRKSPLLVSPSLEISPKAFSILTRARLLSTRGYGSNITHQDMAVATRAIAAIPLWMDILERSVNND
ncbi:nucleotidyltransferase domain-containing protein [Pseudomonas prosekii]|uniref:nucleotidyltransferase domain-containing protein n=1 Tax=Pseudomonas prosekii TaxID=1148509 RepID=UPI00387B8E29